MGFPQRFVRTFRSTPNIHQIVSFGLIGFGSMNLAIWEQILLSFGLALPNGGTGGILLAYLINAGGFALITISLADMARRYPSYAGPFYWTAVLRSSQDTLGLPRLMSWLCAWMSAIGLGINLIVNMLFISDVALFLFTLAGKYKRFTYVTEGINNALQVPWGLPVTICIATFVALVPNWKTPKSLPLIHKYFTAIHWLGFLIFMIALPILYQNTIGLHSTLRKAFHHTVSTSG